MNLNSDLPIPLYYQLEQTIRSEIESGDFSLGAHLPSEAELMKRFAVSRITVQKALNDLAREGFLERKRGKGTVVKASRPETGYSCLTSFTEETLSQGHKPSARVLEFRHMPVPAEIATALAMEPGDRVIFLSRLRLVDELPVCINLTYLPQRLVPDISRKDFSQTGPAQSLYYVLENKFGLRLSQGTETIRPAMVGTEARLLRIRAGSPVILRICTVQDPNGVPLAYQQTITAHEYSSHLRRIKSSTARTAVGAGRND